jgi:predicted NBD/HSP70 family sugar kinase
MATSERYFIRTYNRYNILNSIRKAGMISRVDLSKELGLSKPSLTYITAELINEGLILEKQPAGISQVGRQPILLALNPKGAYAVGVNIEMHKIQVGLINFQAEVTNSYALSLEKDFYSPEELVEKIIESISLCIHKSGFPKKRISGVGIGIPGLIDPRSGIIKFLPNYGWVDINLREMIQKRINIPTFVDNDAKNVTMAEHWFGAGKGLDNFIVILIENGVVAGFVLNGQLVQGDLGLAGAFGHTSIDPQGPLCRCGKRGCIEAYVGLSSIMRDVQNISHSDVWKKYAKKDISISNVVDEAKKGNTEFRRIFDKAGDVFGFGISQLIILMNPKKIIITAIDELADDIFFDPMFDSIKRNLADHLSEYRPDILIKKWNSDVFIKGAGTLVLQKINKS